MSATPDTPELARMKQQLAAAEEQARRLTAELEKFSYSVSHDLRAPLRAINGFSQALLEDYGSTLPPDGQSLLARVRESATRMGRMIDDLLVLSRLGRKQLDIGPVDLASIAQAVVREQRQADPGRAVDVVVGSLPTAVGDAGLLRQVLSNLVATRSSSRAGRPMPRSRSVRGPTTGDVRPYITCGTTAWGST